MQTSFIKEKTRRRLQKAFSVTLAVTTMVWVSGIASILPAFAAMTPHKDGDLIRAQGGTKVYVVKHVGSALYKRWMPSIAHIKAYGHLARRWAQPGNGVVSVNQETIDGHTVSQLTWVGDSPVQSGAKVYWISDDGKTKSWVNMSAAAFKACGWSFASVFTISTKEGALYTNAADTTTCPGGTPAPGTTPSPKTGGSLQVSLASDTPASGIAPESAQANFTKVNLSATGGDVQVTGITVVRGGLSDDDAFSGIVLVDAATGVLIGSEKTLGSDHKAKFTTNFIVKNGTSMGVFVAGVMPSDNDANAGQVGSLGVDTVTVDSASTVSGSFPITGNTQTINSTLAVGSVTTANGGLVPSASTQRVGVSNYVFTAIKLTAGSVEDVSISYIRFNQNGSAGDGDVADLELLQDGAVVASVGKVAQKDKYASFVLSPPIKLTKGNTTEFAIRGTIKSGSGRTVDYVIRDKTDVGAKGDLFGYVIVPTYTNSSAPFFDPSDTTTIDNGIITFVKATSPVLNVAEGATQAELGRFTVTVEGEPIIVTQMVFIATVTDGGESASQVSNVTLYDKDGKSVAGPINITNKLGSSGGRATSTDSVTFPVGTNTYMIKGNISSDFEANDTIVVGITDTDNVIGKGEVTGDTLADGDKGPDADLTLDTMTIKAGRLEVSAGASPATRNVVRGATHDLGSFVFNATDSGEDVKITQLVIRDDVAASADTGDLQNLQLFGDTTALDPIKQPPAGTSAASTTFTFSTPVKVTKGTSLTLRIRGHIKSGATADSTHQWRLDASGVSAVGVDTANTATVVNPGTAASLANVQTVKSGGTMTVATAGTQPSSKLVRAAQPAVVVGELLFTATDEDVDLTSLSVTTTVINPGAGGNFRKQVSKLYLYDGSTLIDSKTPTSSQLTFTMAGVRIPAGATGKRLTVKADFNDVGTGEAGKSGTGLDFRVLQDSYSVKGISSGNLAAGSVSGTAGDNPVAEFTLYKTYPTVSMPSPVSGGVPASGTKSLFRFTVTADPKGDVGLYRFSFAITTTSATVADFTLFENPGGSETALFNNAVRAIDRTYVAESGGRGGIYGLAASSSLFDSGTDGVANGGEYRLVGAGDSKIYELRGTFKNGHELDPSGRPQSQVDIELLGDNAFPNGAYPLPADRAVGGTTAGIGSRDDKRDNDFVWSDLVYGNSSTTATQTAQWTNGYRVPGLNQNSSTSQGLN